MRNPFKAYSLAILLTVASVIATRLTWPLFESTPYAPVFGAVALATQFGSAGAGLLAVFLGTVGALLAFPTDGPFPWDPRTLIMFVGVGVVGSRIIAARNRIAAALRASEAQLRATWEHATLGAVLLDRRGLVERVNPALEHLLGYSAAECIGKPFDTFSHPDEAAAEQQRVAGLIESSAPYYQSERRCRRRDGTLLWGRVTVSVVRGQRGVATGALAVFEDVTAQRQAESDLRASEQKLRQAQKMEAVGQLVAGVAHNFNNLLTVTMGFTDVVLERHADDEEDRDDLLQIRAATERGAALTRQLLAFAHKHEATPSRIDLNRATANLREMLARVIREDIALTIDAAPAPAIVLFDPHDLEQLVFNLVINARDALPDGGTIHIDVGRETLDATNSPPDVTVAPGDYVRLRVRDDGIGMSPEVQAHLFEPFFTTKDVGQGTGLGLAFIHGVVRHAGGFVTVQSAPEQGTTISVYLPQAAAGPAGPPEPAAIPQAPVTDRRPRNATILLVEDEAPVRKVTTDILDRAGFRVLAAASPGEAVALFDEHVDAIDLLLTDIVMPQMHGPTLAGRLVARRPGLPVLFVSGYSDVMPAQPAGMRSVTFLAKPFTPADLVAAVDQLLFEARSA